MALSPSAMLVVLALAVSAFAQEQPPNSALRSIPTPDHAASQPETPPRSCHVTIPRAEAFTATFPVSHLGSPFDGHAWYGTEALWTALPIDGVWRGPDPDSSSNFAYDNKMPWYSNLPRNSKPHGPLTIAGKRIDGPAPVFTETFADAGMVGIAIPAFGCWQVTGHYRDSELTFTVWVAPKRKDKSTGQASTNESASTGSVPRRIFVDRETQAQFLVYRVAPVIPEGVDATTAAATILLHAIISTNGRPKDVQYISGPPLLAQSAIDAVKWWQYAVTMEGEESLEVDTTIEVAFPLAAR